MKARSIKAVLLAASLIFPTWSFAQTKSKDAAAYTNRGSAKVNKGDLDGAIANLNRALQLDPKAASAYVIYVNRGTANFLARNWTAALRDYRRSCELSQRNQAYPRLFIWIIRSRLGEREAADKELATHFNAEPGTWVSKGRHIFLAICLRSNFSLRPHHRMPTLIAVSTVKRGFTRG